MIICGIKITHDGGIALIDNGELKFSIEMEKLNNNHRYSGITDLSEIETVLIANGYQLDQVDRFVIDGWHGTEANWKGDSFLTTRSSEKEIKIPVAGYNETSLQEDITTVQQYPNGLWINGRDLPYSSYRHVTGHVMGTYCASPFSAAGENSYVLVWDGGQYPRLYHVDATTRTISNKGPLFFLLGTIYGIIGHYFGPYKKTAEQLEEDRRRMEFEGFFGGFSIAGKIMSYIAKGNIQPQLLEALPLLYKSNLEVSNLFEHKLCKAIKDFTKDKNYSDADVLLTFHTFLQEQLIANLKKKIARDEFPKTNFCFSGGSALNIKWNSAIRASDIFKDIFVPPFPNDSGSAIGTACAAMWQETKNIHLQWHPYLGPEIIDKEASPGWKKENCSITDLAELLHQSNEPIVFLSGAAEVGPRALGHRSILAAATSSGMQEKLNHAKRREAFRPVAPICLLEDAAKIFDPGCEDPYMLFDHQVRSEWRSKVPAICHLDGSARVQTVSPESKAPTIRKLLEAYKKISGIPLLCNTSANLNGSGFFPDVESATRWGAVKYVWCNDFLYTKTELTDSKEIEEFEEISI